MERKKEDALFEKKLCEMLKKTGHLFPETDEEMVCFLESVKDVIPVPEKYKTTDFIFEEEKSEFNPGDFLFQETSKTVFIHDGNKNSDGYGAVIGFSGGKLCRSSGKNNFQKSGKVRLATEDEKINFIRKVYVAKEIPFYSCV